MKKVCLISLGCPKNLVDSEQILALLGAKHYRLTPEPQESDLVIINTCSFIRDAVKEAKGHIRRITGLKKERKGLKLLVAGCLAQRYPEALEERKEIDGIVGTGDPAKVAEAVTEILAGKRPVEVAPGTFRSRKDFPRLVSTYPYAYLKIAEGCSNFCSYCLIPFLRGTRRSRPVSSIVAEARTLQKQGIKELVLVAQDTTAYGRDLQSGSSLTKLLRNLVTLDIPWIRILYGHPGHVDNSLLELMAGERKICRYLDIPIQHSHPEILKRMNRPVMDYLKFFEKLRKTVPGLRLRSTLLVGFPGESRTHFEYLRQFVKKVGFDRLGVFCYSREQGTPAYDLPGQVPERTKKERQKELLVLQERISAGKLRNMVGKIYPVLIDRQIRKGFVGRTEYDAPEIDGVVRVQGKNLKPGDFCQVLVTKSNSHDLYGTLV